MKLLALFALAGFYINSSSVALAASCTTAESHRVFIKNAVNGPIKGSRDGGKTWTTIGKVTRPIMGGYKLPSVDGGVLAFDFLRGPSSVFGSAVNNLHFRFSDPEGYVLPQDRSIAPPPGHGITLSPFDKFEPEVESEFAAQTNIPGGTGIFGKEWSPRVGDPVKVEVKDGAGFNPIPYEFSVMAGMNLLYVSNTSSCDIESIEFENKADGFVTLKRLGEQPQIVATVTKPVEGIGRFEGSEFVQRPGSIRANHAGVFDIGTTDISTDRFITGNPSVKELRGGFQVVPSFHFSDPSMLNGRDHPFVYMVVEPLIQPAPIQRYDMGIEGSYPLFNKGVRAGMGQTYLKFRNDKKWYELNDAVKRYKFKTDNGAKVIKHLRGVIKDAFLNVTHIQFRFIDPSTPVKEPMP